MSIFSEPYPRQGVDECPSVFVAERVIMCAFSIDGETILCDKLKALTEMETKTIAGFEVKIPRLKSSIGIQKIRKPIGALWNRMSKKAKAMFLSAQYTGAVEYLDNCMDNIKDELGTGPEEPIATPSHDELFGAFR